MNRKCVLVQSKISAEAARKLDDIVERYRFNSRYDVMQYVLSAFLRVADSDHTPDDDDDELVEFAKMFEGFENAKNRVITVRPSTSKNVKLVDSINIYSAQGSKGYTCKSLAIRGDEVHSNASVSKALEIVLKKLHTKLYNKLSMIAQAEQENRLERIIEMLVDGYCVDAESFVSKTMKELDGSIEYGNVPKRHNNKQRYE